MSTYACFWAVAVIVKSGVRERDLNMDTRPTLLRQTVPEQIVVK